MSRLSWAFAMTVLAAALQPASAQAPRSGAPADAGGRLNQEIARLAGQQYVPVGPTLSAPVPAGQRKSVTVQLAADRVNAIVASCGGDCDQVEIALYDYQHILVARSEGSGNVAVETGKPKYSGLYQVEIGVPGCHAAACDVGVAVLRQQGAAPVAAADARSRLDQAVQFLTDQDYAATADPVLGKIRAGQSASFPVTLTATAINAVVATCGPDCDEVQISLYDYQHALVTQSTEKGAIVYKFGKPSYSGLYQVVLAVPGCHAVECDVGLSVLQQRVSSSSEKVSSSEKGSSSETEPGGYQRYDNRDLYGGDLGAPIKNTDVEEKCSSACSREDRCRGYSFDKWNNYCYLKSKITSLRMDPRSISGLRAGLPSPSASAIVTKMERYRGRAFGGSGYRSVKTAKFEGCETECQGDDKCVAYTFQNAGQSCTLYDTTTAAYMPSKGSESGGKVQPSD
jgi:PAN domain